MENWKQKFDQDTLDRGKSNYLNQRVVDLTETSGGYESAVLGRTRITVSAIIRGGRLGRMKCGCPAAKGGRNCEHMAALLYAIEARTRAKAQGITEAELLEKEQKAEAELREKEERQRAEEQRLKRERQAARLRRQQEAKLTPEERQRLKEEREAEKKRRAEELKAVAEQEKKKQKQARLQKEKEAEQARLEKEKEAREALRQQEEREARRLAREQRKAEMARKKEEQKRLAEEARRQETEKRLAEEARRQKLREQKAEEARLRAEKRKKEQEEARRNAEKRRKEEEMRRQKEAKRREEEQRRQEEEKQKALEAKKRAEEKRRKEEEEKQKAEEARRQQQERRKAEFSLLGDSWEAESESAEAEQENKNIERLERYKYFKGTLIKHSIKIPADVMAKGEKLYAQGDIEMKDILTGFDQYSEDIRGQIDVVGRSGNMEFPVRIIFSRTNVTYTECRCPQCIREFYSSWDIEKTKCPYKAGTLKLLEDYLDTHSFGDATDSYGKALLKLYQEKRSNLAIADTEDKKESLRLVPRLTRKDGKLSVAFKIGEKKLFIVKKLDDFCENVKNSATATYGSNTQINHNLDHFTESGKGWIRFINRIVREEEEFLQRIQESNRYDYYGSRKTTVGGALNLFGWRLDEFYNQMADEAVEFEDKDGWEKRKEILTRAERNPNVSMRISEEKVGSGRVFHGIRVDGGLPELYMGTDTGYYIGDGQLCRVEKDFQEKIEPLSRLTSDEGFSFHVGRNHMAEFYYRILPQLEEIVDIEETEPEKFRSYLPPEVRFVFYLDAADQNVTCQVSAKYGGREFSALDVLSKQDHGGIEALRDVSREEEILFHVMQWFPRIDWEREELHCGGDEELVYQVMESGTEKLMELGEVRCTKSFLNHHVVRRMKVSVGVSVSSGLLDLSITTEDIPQAELLDILASYRAKKKYYRLKDGSFMNLDDSSLQMLSEMMDAMHLKPKEFVKGKMHLPMYRTLYLDKMLEENDSVYSKRDSHFRKVVKGFKTVKDADFEEPESLSRIMRKYQKNGFKWLRTLEAWQFGGILADDMGLGKTLQVIAVLLAAKQEGKEGTSLVVAPASLIFNWGEEFERFAPELRVSLITGNQEERQNIIASYQEVDVLVTSYDLLKRDILFYEEKQFLYQIIDEAQYIKNHTTAAAKAVKVIHSQTRYALTGTPIENRLSELWSIFDYLMPGFLYGYDVFKREMESPIVKSSDEAAMTRLQKMAGPFILRRLKGDVLKDLPEKLEEHRYVRFGSTQQKLYDGQVLHMKETLAQQNEAEFNKNKLLILAELTRLRQICCDPSLCFENYKGEAAKLEACLQLIQSAIDGGHRMLVFSQFTSMLEILQDKLSGLNIAYYTITGSTSKEKRLQMVKEFNEGEVPVFLISLKAGGVGLNLTGADVVIHYDPWWNLAVQNQATDRAHRIGQTKKVTVYKLIAKGTIEEKIQKLQEKKKDLAEQVIGGEAAQLGSLGREEIMELLGV
ncbi:MAG: DEAD/DEAH box helicase [Ruminococcus sp.]|nr:DEAD/DEAH box helicase [Ruminococcus sp.]